MTEQFNPQKWVGRKFKCKLTDETLTIPSDVKAGQFFSFGDCFIDVGDGYYFRKGGCYEEIIEEGNNGN